MVQIRFKSDNHARAFVIVMTALGLGVYFSPTLYRAFVLPRKLERERQERLLAIAAKEAAEKKAGQPTSQT